MIKKLTLGLLAILAMLVTIVLANTYTKGTRQVPVQPVPHVRIDENAAVGRFAGAVPRRVDQLCGVAGLDGYSCCSQSYFNSNRTLTPAVAGSA